MLMFAGSGVKVGIELFECFAASAIIACAVWKLFPPSPHSPIAVLVPRNLRCEYYP